MSSQVRWRWTKMSGPFQELEFEFESGQRTFNIFKVFVWNRFLLEKKTASHFLKEWPGQAFFFFKTSPFFPFHFFGSRVLWLVKPNSRHYKNNLVRKFYWLEVLDLTARAQAESVQIIFSGSVATLFYHKELDWQFYGKVIFAKEIVD